MFSAACAVIFFVSLITVSYPSVTNVTDQMPLQYYEMQPKKWNFDRYTGSQNHIISSMNYCLISQSYQTTSRDSFAFIMGSRILKAEGKTFIRRLFQHRYMYICCSLSCSSFNFKSPCFAIMALTINVTHCIQRCQLSRNLIFTSYLN